MTAHRPQATTIADRRHPTWLYFYYLSALILPGGALLILLRQLWLRLHM